MTDTPLTRALEQWALRDDMGGFKAAGDILFPGWQARRSCRAPDREDKSPSFSVYQNEKGDWRFKDFTTDAQGGLVGFVALAGMSDGDASRWLMEAAGGATRDPMPTRQAKPAAKPQPRQPYAMTRTELHACVSMAEELLRSERAVRSIAAARGWQLSTIRQLAFWPCMGVHEAKLVYIYPTGAKKRFKPLTPEMAADFDGVPFRWIFGKPHSLWRSDQISRATETVHITEGETAAISLIDSGLDNGASEIVTAAASATSWRDEWAPLFRGRRVVIWPDADDAGEKLKERVIESLGSVARSIEVAAAAGEAHQ